MEKAEIKQIAAYLKDLEEGLSEWDYRGIKNVMKSIVQLNQRNIPLSLNVYAPASIKDYEIKELYRFSLENSCTLKFLIPCHIKDLNEQERHSDIMSARLLKMGCVKKRLGDYFCIFESSEGLQIRIVKPWCPQACQRPHEST